MFGVLPVPVSVEYSTVVRVSLPNLPRAARLGVWGDRQVQSQAFNWGVEDALRSHFAGERIASPRNNSKPLTKHRQESGSEHALLVHRGGYWSAVDAVKKWSKRRRGLVYAQSKTAERSDKALTVLAALAALADKHGLGAVSVRCAAMSDAVTVYRGHRRRLVELADSTAKAALHLRPERPDAALTQLSPDERAELSSEAVEAADKALEVFNTELKGLRAAIAAADVSDAVRKRLRNAATKSKTQVGSEDKADKKLLSHVAKGEMRLFRRRRDLERCAGPALVFFEGCTIRDGNLRLPGGTLVPLPKDADTIEGVLGSGRGDNLVWTGALHLVDVTDKAGKVTRRTRPEHRKYQAHFLCRAEAAAPSEPTAPEHTLGADWGVAVSLVTSDGTPYGRHATFEQQAANSRRHGEAKKLQQSMAEKREGSRRYRQQRRRRAKLIAKNSNVRINHQLHVAKAVVTTPCVRTVTLEDTNISNMTASAEGTKAFPTRGSTGKRGLNRSIAETAPARQAAFIERAGTVYSKSVKRANPAFTSLTCFVCGTQGQRETQTLFWCPECGSYTQADVQAALNVNETGNPGLYPSSRETTHGGRDSRHKTLEAAVEAFLEQTDDNGNVTNKYTTATHRHSCI